MARKKRPGNTGGQLPETKKHCHYQNGKRSFSGNARDVAKYAFRDQYWQWIMLLVGVVLLGLSLFCGTSLGAGFIISFLKRCFG